LEGGFFYVGGFIAIEKSLYCSLEFENEGVEPFPARQLSFFSGFFCVLLSSFSQNRHDFYINNK